MIIATTNDLIEVGTCGCPCLIPVCDEPRKECQSISTEACGYSLPEHADLTDEERCMLFAKRTVSWRDVYSFSDETTTINSDEQNTSVWQMWDDGTACSERLFSTNYDETETNLVVIEGVTTSDQTTVIHLQSGIGEACNGTVTYTDGVDPENSYTDTLDTGCLSVDLTPDSSWSYAAYAYTKTIVDGDTTTTQSVVFSDPIDAAALNDQLDRKISLIAEGDPWPGTQCLSSTHEARTLDGEGNVICSQIDAAQKARYRFGVPIGYSTAEHPRSTYEAQWDEVFFPDGWDSGEPGAPLPILIASRAWTWGGSMDEPWSDWYVMEVPTDPGETRVVNIMILCYRSTRLGQKPTAYGEVYVFPT